MPPEETPRRSRRGRQAGSSRPEDAGAEVEGQEEEVAEAVTEEESEPSVVEHPTATEKASKAKEKEHKTAHEIAAKPEEPKPTSLAEVHRFERRHGRRRR
jgi:hypothetical protein